MEPWSRERKGTLVELEIESELLRGNPLGDPHARPLWVYLPPAYATEPEKLFPTIYLIQGMTGQIDMWANRSAFRTSTPENVDRLFAEEGCPPAVVVYADCWTSYGGSQFIDSPGTGRYLGYLCDEVVPFVDSHYRTLAAPAHRGLTGKSSGGYGAMVVPMLRPDVFGALASHAGDALFDSTIVRSFPQVVRLLRDHFDGSYDAFFATLGDIDPFRFAVHGVLLETYAYAACYSPDPERPGRALLPFDVQTSRLVPDVWQRWLAWDPVRLVPEHLDALAGLRRIYLDAGRSDEYYLDLGAQGFSEELTKLGVAHTLELFDGKHGGITYRYPGAIRELVLALA